MAAKRVPVGPILDTLAEMYPDAKCALEHTNAFELLVATMLSAQCTDARVNIVTRRMFPVVNTPEQFAALTPEQIGEMIKDCGLWQTKAKNIHLTSRLLLEKHGGQVPGNMDDLVALPGVGRKTANVVLSNAFGVPAIAVDTHVLRVSNRLGLANAATPEETEQQLMRRIPRDLWSQAHHWIIHHGRQICDARKPKCSECPLLQHCQFGQAGLKQAAKATKPAKQKPSTKSAAKKATASSETPPARRTRSNKTEVAPEA
jgi:endonuclease-3